MKKSTALVIAIPLMAYYIFVSGLIFEITGSTKMDSLDTPYSIAFSNERIGFVGIFNEDDIACAKWLAYDTDPEILVWVDYLGMSLLIDYTGYTKGSYEKPERPYYLFLHTWNVESGKRVYGWFEGTREYVGIPDLTDAKEVFRRGKAVVYEIK